jgi:hypothetical protein
VIAPTFVAGVVVRDRWVIEAAPILRRRAVGLDRQAFYKLCRRNGWTWQRVPSLFASEA